MFQSKLMTIYHNKKRVNSLGINISGKKSMKRKLKIQTSIDILPKPCLKRLNTVLKIDNLIIMIVYKKESVMEIFY